MFPSYILRQLYLTVIVQDQMIIVPIFVTPAVTMVSEPTGIRLTFTTRGELYPIFGGKETSCQRIKRDTSISYVILRVYRFEFIGERWLGVGFRWVKFPFAWKLKLKLLWQIGPVRGQYKVGPLS